MSNRTPFLKALAGQCPLIGLVVLARLVRALLPARLSATNVMLVTVLIPTTIVLLARLVPGESWSPAWSPARW